MAKHNRKFALGLLIYALAFLLLMAVGLTWLWQYMEDFEDSRPDGVLNGYMQSLSAEYVADRSEVLLDSVDAAAQTREQARQAIIQALNGNFTCAKKSKESSDTRHVYAVRCGSRVIGTMEMERCGEYTGSFQSWTVTKEAFDLSYLLSEPVSITVPENYPVYCLGNLLPATHITKNKIPYDLLKDLYEDYTLPYMVTYTAGPVLGEAVLTATDPEGNAVAMDKDTDMTVFLNNCTGEQTDHVDAHVTGFIRSYVDFMSCTGGDTQANYGVLSAYIVPGGELANRMKAAFDGLNWVTDRGAKITQLTVNNRYAMADGRYFCDVTYVVDTKDFAGSIQTTAHVKLILLQTENGLKTEAMKNG